MKTVTLKTGTRAEILKYLDKKIKATAIDNYKLKGGVVYQKPHGTVKMQIDEFIRDGSPLVTVVLQKVTKYKGSSVDSPVAEQFIVSDYSKIRTEMELIYLNSEAAVLREEVLAEMGRAALKRNAAADAVATKYKDSPIKAKIVPIFSDAS